MKNRKHDSRVIDAVNARAKTYRVLCHLMRVEGPSLATRIVAASVQKCHDEAVLKETAIGQACQFIVKGQVFVVLKLILEQEKNHPDGHHILGQIPDLALEMYPWIKRLKEGRDDEDRRPGEESGDCDEGAGGGAPVAEPEMEAASKIDREQHSIQGEICAISRPVLYQQQENRESAIQRDDGPAQKIAEQLNGKEGHNDG